MSKEIEQLRQSYKPFRDFYDAKIRPLNATIRWYSDPALNASEAASAVNHVWEDEDGLHQDITLGNISADEDTAFIYAHELASLVTASEGYRNVESLEACSILGGDLNNMIHVPLRDSKLAEYGFDVENEFWVNYGAILSLDCGAPLHPSSVPSAAFAYVRDALYWQTVLGQPGVQSDFDSHYRECYPKAWEKGRGILEIAYDIRYNVPGNDTPENVVAFFRSTISYSGLGQCIRLLD